MSNDNTIRVDWDNQNAVWWNEVCADIIEVFGLPGNRYTSSPCQDFMEFNFNNFRDAELCRILLSERI